MTDPTEPSKPQTTEIILPFLVPAMGSNEALKAIAQALKDGQTIRIAGVQSPGVAMHTLIRVGTDQNGNAVFGMGPRTLNEMTMQVWVDTKA